MDNILANLIAIDGGRCWARSMGQKKQFKNFVHFKETNLRIMSILMAEFFNLGKLYNPQK